MALILVFSSSAMAAGPKTNFRDCTGSSFRECYRKDCYVDACPVTNGKPVCDPLQMNPRFPPSRAHADFVTFKNASRPLKWSAEGKAKGTFLFVHGLSDSPYTFGLMAEAVSKYGYNSVAILLTGHGADNATNNRMTTITKKAWLEDVDKGFDYARELYPNTPIFLSGFSTGGALSVLYLTTEKGKKALPGPSQSKDRPLKGIVLFDAALAVPGLNGLALDAMAEFQDLRNKIRKGIRITSERDDLSKDTAAQVGTNPARVPFMTSKIAPALGDVIDALGEKNYKMKIPTIAFFTSGAGNDPGDYDTIDSKTSKERLEMYIDSKAPLTMPEGFEDQTHNQLLTYFELGACVPVITVPGKNINMKFKDLASQTIKFANDTLKASAKAEAEAKAKAEEERRRRGLASPRR